MNSPNSTAIELGVTEFVSYLNQTLDYAYPDLVIVGELANFRVSKNKWVYFDLKDEQSSVKFFGTIYNLPGPLEDGMIIRVSGTPRLHNLYGFSVNVISMQPIGEGSIRKAAELLALKLTKEGLFDDARKRPLPYPPISLGLIASKQSAAYADFIKILNARWVGVHIYTVDVQVQGDVAPEQIVQAFDQFNALSNEFDALVLIRGGGSPEDLAAFNTEIVTRAVAGSRIPTIVAIGHEVDISLAELAADQRASTPSNAAELLVPDKKTSIEELHRSLDRLHLYGEQYVSLAKKETSELSENLSDAIKKYFDEKRQTIENSRVLLEAYNPHAILQRGYAIVRKQGVVVREGQRLKSNDIIEVEFTSSTVSARVEDIKSKSKVHIA